VSVSELFLNGTSAQCRLFSAKPLKVEEKYNIQSKCKKQNKWATIQEKKTIWNCTNEYLSKKKGYHQNWPYQI